MNRICDRCMANEECPFSETLDYDADACESALLKLIEDQRHEYLLAWYEYIQDFND